MVSTPWIFASAKICAMSLIDTAEVLDDTAETDMFYVMTLDCF